MSEDWVCPKCGAVFSFSVDKTGKNRICYHCKAKWELKEVEKIEDPEEAKTEGTEEVQETKE